jgi:hypothetical protein
MMNAIENLNNKIGSWSYRFDVYLCKIADVIL